MRGGRDCRARSRPSLMPSGDPTGASAPSACSSTSASVTISGGKQADGRPGRGVQISRSSSSARRASAGLSRSTATAVISPRPRWAATAAHPREPARRSLSPFARTSSRKPGVLHHVEHVAFAPAHTTRPARERRAVVARLEHVGVLGA